MEPLTSTSIISAIESGKSVKQVAVEHDVSQSTVRRICQHLNMQGVRRSKLVDAIRAGRTFKEIRKTYNTCWQTLRRLANEEGIVIPERRGGKPKREHYAKVDWSQKNCVIARQLGVSDSAVYQMRKKIHEKA